MKIPVVAGVERFVLVCGFEEAQLAAPRALVVPSMRILLTSMSLNVLIQS